MFALVILALVDSLSVGTLVIPLILLLQPVIRWKMIAIYCFVLGLFYFALGIMLLLGLGAVLEPLSALIQSQAGQWLQLLVGGLLLTWALLYDSTIVNNLLGKTKKAKKNPAAQWEARLAGKSGLAGIASLALVAGLIEAATMAPYIAALGILGTSDLSVWLRILSLFAYCVLMFTPAIVLILIRTFSGNKLDVRLQKFKNWVSNEAAATTPWIVGLIGFYMASLAARSLFF